MEPMSNYPPLRLLVLNQLADLKQQMLLDPDYLTSEDCPYDDETKQLLASLLARETVEVVVEKEVGVEKAGRGRPSKEIKLSADDQQLVLDGIKTTLSELDAMAKQTNMETSEKIQVAKTRTSLLDQLLKMQERHTSIAKMGQFVEDVVNILNDVGSEKDREMFLAKLEKYR